jgi:hypothetical protein
MSAQPRAPHHRGMDNPDDALLTAADRAREAQARLRETPIEDPAIVPKADKVEQRAEEVSELAKDALADDLANGGPNSA